MKRKGRGKCMMKKKERNVRSEREREERRR